MDVAVRDINDDIADDSAAENGAGTVALQSQPQSQPLASVLAALGERVAPVSMARERVLPVAAGFAGLFPEGGLVRGRVLSCQGDAATSTSLRLAAAAVAAGSWLAVVDVPTLGLDAACELGVPLERVVAIDTAVAGDDLEERATRWADVVAAAADGFEVILTRVPVEVAAGTVRKVATRLQQRGVVMLVLGNAGALVCDGVVETGEQVWSGVGLGWGHLQHRTVDVVATGRRVPGRRCVSMSLPPVEPSAEGVVADVPADAPVDTPADAPVLLSVAG